MKPGLDVPGISHSAALLALDKATRAVRRELRERDDIDTCVSALDVARGIVETAMLVAAVADAAVDPGLLN